MSKVLLDIRSEVCASVLRSVKTSKFDAVRLKISVLKVRERERELT